MSDEVGAVSAVGDGGDGSSESSGASAVQGETIASGGTSNAPNGAGGAPPAGGEALDAVAHDGETAVETAERLVLKMGKDERELSPAEAEALVSVFGSLERAQKAYGADRRFDEAHKVSEDAKKLRERIDQDSAQIRQVVQRLSRDPVLSAYLKGDNEAFLNAVADRLEYDGMSPEERAKVDRRRQVETDAELGRRYKQEMEARRNEARISEYQQTFTQQAKESLEAVGLELNEYTMERWAAEMQAAMSRKVDLTPAQAAERVLKRNKGHRQNELKRLASLEDDNSFYEEFPPEVLTRLRRIDAGRMKAKMASRPAAQSNARSEAAPGNPISATKWLRAVQEYGPEEANRLLDAGEL